MEEYMLLEAPRSELLDLLPRFAANAAPAAICCFLDFAGIAQLRPGKLSPHPGICHREAPHTSGVGQ